MAEEALPPAYDVLLLPHRVKDVVAFGKSVVAAMTGNDAVARRTGGNAAVGGDVAGRLGRKPQQLYLKRERLWLKPERLWLEPARLWRRGERQFLERHPP
jgi:hypothetical protein